MKALLVGNPVPACITQRPAFTNACLDTVVLTIATAIDIVMGLVIFQPMRTGKC